MELANLHACESCRTYFLKYSSELIYNRLMIHLSTILQLNNLDVLLWEVEFVSVIPSCFQDIGLSILLLGIFAFYKQTAHIMLAMAPLAVREHKAYFPSEVLIKIILLRIT